MTIDLTDDEINALHALVAHCLFKLDQDPSRFTNPEGQVAGLEPILRKLEDAHAGDDPATVQ